MKIFQTRFRPLCGLYLQSAIMWLTIFHLAFDACGVVRVISAIIDRWFKWQEESVSYLQNHYIRMCFWIGFIAKDITTLAIDYRLYKCSRTRDIPKLRSCMIYTSIILAWGIIVYTYFTFEFGVHFQSMATYIPYIAYKSYLVVIIHFLIKEIEDENEEKSANRSLTDEEIEEFQKRIRESSTMLPEMLALRVLEERVVHMQCEKSLQIEPDNLKIDTASPLGAGAYGSVYKGQLNTKHGLISVAVKTTHPSKPCVMFFKAMLSELMVFARLGKHEHVVEFLGASTSEIRERKLFIAMELCSFGSIYSFLKNSTGLFVNNVRDGKMISVNQSNCVLKMIDEGESITTEDLIRWSHEIASGMEFLQSKNVIHGDLAARNVLLTGNKVAKITDFGLARQLYSYSVYVKRQKSPLPWRHLAIESISDMTFSSFSDVWSYAVTLWEIFTLIETPWMQHEFNIKFVEQLKQGMRLNLPKYAPTDVYELMLNCWKKEPSERPQFSKIIQFFTNNYRNVKDIPVNSSRATGTTYLETEL